MSQETLVERVIFQMKSGQLYVGYVAKHNYMVNNIHMNFMFNCYEVFIIKFWERGSGRATEVMVCINVMEERWILTFFFHLVMGNIRLLTTCRYQSTVVIIVQRHILMRNGVRWAQWTIITTGTITAIVFPTIVWSQTSTETMRVFFDQRLFYLVGSWKQWKIICFRFFDSFCALKVHLP